MATFSAGQVTAKIGADISGWNKAMKTVADSSAKTFSGASSAASGTTGKFSLLNSTVGKIAVGVGAVGLITKGIGVLTSSVGGAVARFDTLNAYPKVMKQMGYSTQDTNKSIGILKKGVDGLPTSLQDLTKSSQSFAILTKSATQGAKTATALNDAFLASGASAGDASRGVQQYSQMLASGKVDMQSWRTMQETMPYALTQVAKAFGLTGKSAEKDLYAKLQSGEITMDQLNDKFIELDGGLNGFANTARTATGGIGTSFTNMRNAVTNGLANMITSIDSGLKNAGITNGIAGIFNQAKITIVNSFTAINAAVKTAIPPIVSTIKGMVDFVKQNKDWIMPLVVGIGSAMVAFKAFIVVVKTASVIASIAKEIQLVVFAFNNVKNAAGIAKGAMVAFNVATGANPIGAVVLAITALVAALAYFFTQTATGKKLWSEFVKFTVDKWNGLVSTIKSVGTAIVGAWNNTVTAIKNIWKSIPGFFSGIWSQITAGVSSTGQGIADVWNSAVNYVMGVWSNIVTFFSALWSGIILTLQPLFTALTDGWNNAKTNLSGIWNGIVTIAGSVWNLLKDAIMGPILLVLDLIMGDFTQLGIDAANIWNNIVSSLGSIWTGLVQIASTTFNIAMMAIINIWNTVSSTTVSIWNSIVSTVTGIWNSFVSGASKFASDLFNGVLNTWNAIPGWALGLWNTVKSNVFNTWDGMVSGGSSFANNTFNSIKGVWNSIPGWASSLWNSVKSITSSIWSGIYNVTYNMSVALVRGIRGAWSGVTGWASSVWNGVQSAIRGAMNFDLWGAGQAIMNSFFNGLISAWGKVKSFVGGIASWIREHKGPISYDRKLLIPAGAAIMGGFGSSLNANFADVKKSVSSYAGQIADEFGQQKYVASARLTTSSTGVAGQINGGLSALSDEVAEQSVQEPVFLINNELVGDKIVTMVNTKNARDRKRISIINQ